MYCQQTDVGGYDVELMQEVPDSLVCILCHLILRDPVQIMNCGHRFCNACFDRMKNYCILMKSDLCCPVDRKIIDNEKVFKDTGVARDIGDLKVKCSNKGNGCAWEGELSNLKDHLNTCQAKENSGITKGTVEESSIMFSQVFQRLNQCEEDMLRREKEIVCLKLDVHEIKSYNTRKDSELFKLGEEMTSLKEKNCQYEEEIKMLKEENRKQNEEMKYIKDSMMVLTNQNVQLEKDIKQHGEEDRKLVQLENNLCDKITSTHTRIRNVENFVFYTGDVPSDATVYKWKLRHYRYFSKHCTSFKTSIFDARPTGYRCYLYVIWSGENNNNVGLYFMLCKAPDGTKPFSMHISFEIIDTYGNKIIRTITPDTIEANRESMFTVHRGEEMSKKACGFPNILTMPKDQNYIIDNSLTITCCLTTST